jgi:hypothetical protein
MKWALHPHASMGLWLDKVTSDHQQEHFDYSKGLRWLQIEDCVSTGRNGGTWLQIVGRRGRLEAQGYSGGYTQGNPYHMPAGHEGWALIRRCRIDGRNIWSRKASELTFANGFGGPIVIHDVEIIDAWSAAALWSDIYKGCNYKVPGDETVYSYVSGVHAPEEIPAGAYLYPLVIIDNLTVRPNGHDNRPQVMISGAKEVRIGKITVEGGSHAIMFDGDGGPFKCGTIKFYHEASVTALAGRIGYGTSSGSFRAYTESELGDMLVSATPGAA